MGLAADATKLSDNMEEPRTRPVKLVLAPDGMQALGLGSYYTDF